MNAETRTPAAGNAPRTPASGIGGVLIAAALCWVGIAGSALANDLSDYPCTAGDVEIVGNGIIVNEPCSCATGTLFNARVMFTVRNNTSTNRYCIALHLVPDGELFTAPFDVILRDAGGSSNAQGKSGGERYHDTVMFGTIENFPCSAGRVCFGQAGVVRGKCAVGTCTTVSWNTSPGNAMCISADQTPPGGQCRHQQVCVVGFGATLQCVANCTPVCGDTTTLRACITAPTSRGPFSVNVSGSDGSSQTQSTFGDSTGAICLDFKVRPTQSPKTTYTLTVTDRDTCTRKATTSVDLTPTQAVITPPSSTGCNGIMRYTASVSGRTGCSFTWTVDGLSLTSFRAGGAADDARVARTSGTNASVFEFRALDNACHTIRVASSCPSSGLPCTSSASIKARECASPGASCP